MAPMSCPPDCGRCCSNLVRPDDEGRRAEERAFLDELAEHGVYRCRDRAGTGLSLTNAEAATLGATAQARRLRVALHPRTFLLETRKRRCVVVDWHLAHVACPFLDGARCTVYEARPMPCRAFPVLGPAPRWVLAPSCPRVEDEAWADEGKAAYFRAEAKARRALDAAQAGLDEAFALTSREGLRFATGLSVREAVKRRDRWKRVGVEEFARTYGTASTR